MAQKKIALVGFHLYGGGGARIMANLSVYLAQQGIDIHNIIIHDEVGYRYAGTLYNLGKLKSKRNSIFNKIKRLRAFRNYVHQENFDYIIDFRFRKRNLQELLISRLVYKGTKSIYTIHSSKLDVYLPKSKFWTKVIYGNSHAIIALTNKMHQQVKDLYPFLSRLVIIPNTVDLEFIKDQAQGGIDLGFEYILAVGAFENNYKQFDKLIEAYAKTVLPDRGIHLVILGTGQLLKSLESVARKNDLEEMVHFLGQQPNPFKYMAAAKYLVLSSAFEGFPMVLIEALASGIPVVSFDCDTGPSDIIVNEDNGLLIENQNLPALIQAMNRMVEDAALYQHWKTHARRSVSRFALETIGPKWLDILK
jgi:N-acetylgalactosamine-N,N'-diacetylbacillosaminyl-diphospho-undecaprenol 4-alpha-N-acetylgalactosaminyltransferase